MNTLLNASPAVLDNNAVITNNPAAIPTYLAMALAKTYKKNQYQVINDGMCITDSRCAWLSLDTIKAFLSGIEQKSMENFGYDSSRLGVRIYFGAYPKADAPAADWAPFPQTEPDGTPTRSYAGKHTILMVPTFNDVLNIDFDPNQIVSGTLPPHAIPKTMADIFSGPIIQPIIVMMQDHSSLVPPPEGMAPGHSAPLCGTSFMDCVDNLSPVID
jgi:hypothetical protein